MKLPRPNRKVSDSALLLALAGITLALFWPVSGHGFIELDDPDYILANPHVQQGVTVRGLCWAFTAGYASNWHPITWISHMIDCQSFKLNPGAHHLVSVAFHVASTLMLFVVLRRMTGAKWRSAAVAALFAWHPSHVESVAWVAERKDTLSAFFFMLTLWAYERYAKESKVQSPRPKVLARRSRAGEQAPRVPVTRGNSQASWVTGHASRYYLLAVTLFALGLMSKPMLVTVPLVLLLLDYWPLRRFQASLPQARWRLLLEKLPFLILALAVGIVTVAVQQAEGSVQSLAGLPIATRLANALVSYVSYLGEMFWPVKLSVFYPLHPIPAWQVLGSGLLLVAVMGVVLRFRRLRPYLLVGWCWFLGMLLPVIGLLQVGLQARADRYTYLPFIGLFMIFAWGLAELASMARIGRLGLSLGAGALLGGCLVTTRYQLGYWRDSVTLLTRALEVTSPNAVAHYTLGVTLAKQEDVGGAEAHYRAALAIKPDYEQAYDDLGIIFARQGKYPEALVQFEAAVRQSHGSPNSHGNLGNLYALLGDNGKAAAHYSIALRLRPGNATVAQSLARVLAKETELTASRADLQASLKLLPDAELRASVADAWVVHGSIFGAVEAYRQALELAPESPQILNRLAWQLAAGSEPGVRNGPEAVGLAQRACDLTGFKDPNLVRTLAVAYAEAGRFAEAVSTAETACTLAAQSGDPAMVASNKELLESLRAGRAYHEPATRAQPGAPR